MGNKWATHRRGECGFVGDDRQWRTCICPTCQTWNRTLWLSDAPDPTVAAAMTLAEIAAEFAAAGWPFKPPTKDAPRQAALR